MESSAPQIFFVSLAKDSVGVPGTIFPFEGGTRAATVTFLVEDLNGANDLDDATAAIVFNSTAGTLQPGTCISAACPSCPVTQSNYTCEVNMEYYFEPSPPDWSVNVSIRDLAGNLAINDSTTFFYNPLSAVDHATVLSWTGISLVDPNQPADNPFTLTNIGNEVLNPGITAFGLNGSTDVNQQIPASDFSVSDLSGGNPPAECDVPATATALIDDNSVATGVSVPVFPASNGEADLNFCIYPSLVDLNLDPSQSYSTLASEQSWSVDI